MWTIILVHLFLSDIPDSSFRIFHYVMMIQLGFLYNTLGISNCASNTYVCFMQQMNEFSSGETTIYGNYPKPPPYPPTRYIYFIYTFKISRCNKTEICIKNFQPNHFILFLASPLNAIYISLMDNEEANNCANKYILFQTKYFQRCNRVPQQNYFCTEILQAIRCHSL